MRTGELAPSVYASLIARVALLGPESSGKTTLAVALAHALETRYAAEYGRELWVQREGRFDEACLLTIAREQVRREESLLCDCRDVLVCDTSPLTTVLYSQLLFGRVAADLEELAARQYELTVYCEPDFGFVQDGTRAGEDFQRRQDALGRAELQRRNIDVLVVRGSVEQRITQVLEALQARRLLRPFAH
jgi:HTH-type transcriptional regulator, transcriptional repressor of NAD biosynthesis genes